MAVKDFENNSGLNAIVVNAKGKVWKFNGDLPEKVQKKVVIGTDTFANELGEKTLYIWID